jgi:hypothetical protein
MNYNEDKIDEYTLALMCLVTHERHEGMGARAWKGFDWETLNRLHEKGYISNPRGKTKSVLMTEDGFLKAKELFDKYFTEDMKKDIKPIPFPKMPGAAKQRWAELSSDSKKAVINSAWCTRCMDGTTIQISEGRMSGRSLVLRGTCKKCGGKVARTIEPED